MINYGEIIKRIRKQKDLTQREMADICHCTQAAIQKIENGVIKSITADIMSELFYKLDVDPYVFIVPRYPYTFIDQSKTAKYEVLIREMAKIMQQDDKMKQEITEAKTVKAKSAKNVVG